MRTSRVRIALAAALLPLLVAVSGLHAEPNPHAALDCNFCHFDTPRFGTDTRETVNFWRAEGDEPQLCERCHRPEKNLHPLGVTPDPQRAGTRRPKNLPLGASEAVRDQVVCVSCHDVHAADGDLALLRGFPGSDQPNLFRSWQDLCRECHGAGLEKRSPHAGDERACILCHSARPQPGQPTVVTPVGRRLCEFCHGSMGAEHYAGVNPYPDQRDCTGCHDPHLGGEHRARLKEGYFDPIRDSVTVNPHFKKTLCFACHADGKPGPLRDAGVALCQRCHGSGKIPGMSHPLTNVPAGYTIPGGWPLSGGALTCLTCHMAGHAAGAVPGRADDPAGALHLLRGAVAGERTAVCFRCHARGQWTGKDPHEDAAQKQTGCTRCHAEDPESGDSERFVADIDILCLACHDQGDHPAGIRHTVTLTPAMPAVPGNLPLGTGRRITCATCHDPHVFPPVGHMLRGAKEPSAFCVRCHKL